MGIRPFSAAPHRIGEKEKRRGESPTHARMGCTAPAPLCLRLFLLFVVLLCGLEFFFFSGLRGVCAHLTMPSRGAAGREQAASHRLTRSALPQPRCRCGQRRPTRPRRRRKTTPAFGIKVNTWRQCVQESGRRRARPARISGAGRLSPVPTCRVLCCMDVLGGNRSTKHLLAVGVESRTARYGRSSTLRLPFMSCPPAAPRHVYARHRLR